MDFPTENPLKGSKGILKCRALEAARAVGAPCGFVAYLAVDHQMTPTLFAGFSGPSALSPRSLADRLSGSASRPLRPCALRALWVREVVAPVDQRESGIFFPLDNGRPAPYSV